MNVSLVTLLAALLLPNAANANPRALSIDKKRSKVEIEVQSTIDSFVARIDAFEVTSTMGADLKGAATADFRFRFADLKSGDAERDGQMSLWENVQKYPDGEFKLAAIVPATAGKFIIRGRLRLHGVEREISVPASITSRAKIVTVDGETDLDTRDYGLPIYRRYIFITVHPVVHVRFHLVGSLAAQ